MRTYDFAPLWRSTIGFDRLFDLLDETQRATEDHYPRSGEGRQFRQRPAADRTLARGPRGHEARANRHQRDRFPEKNRAEGSCLRRLQHELGRFRPGEFGSLKGG